MSVMRERKGSAREREREEWGRTGEPDNRRFERSPRERFRGDATEAGGVIPRVGGAFLSTPAGLAWDTWATVSSLQSA